MHGWIHSRGFDLTFIIGGAFLSLALALLTTWQTGMVLALFWAWVIFLEGPHFAVTWIRTFGDRRFVSGNRKLLLASFLFFLVPMAAILIDGKFGNPGLMAGWGFAIFLWSLYHNTRQHYGFMALWGRKAKLLEKEIAILRWSTYLVCYFLMAELLFTFKLAEAYPHFSALVPWKPVQNVSSLLAGLTFLSVAAYFRRKAFVPVFYLGTVALYYYLLFYVLARLEPLHSSPRSGAEGFLLVTALNSSFHNIQYLAITFWKARQDEVKDLHPKLALAFAFGLLIFGPIFWARGEVSIAGSAATTPLLLNLAYVLYFGIVGQHFFLDQFIWRKRSLLPVGDKAAAC